jgi:pyridoxal phosphate enzyme (YggS family)
MNHIAANLKAIKQQIQMAEQEYGRKTGSVQLLAASKGQSVEKIRTAIIAEQHSFAENYAQEALTKITALQQDNLEWHFIGKIQSNKTKAIAENFVWAHSIDRLQIAKRLNEQRPVDLPALNVCIEVNVSEEKTKSGVMLSELSELAKAIVKLPHLKLRGLMTIPAPANGFSEQRKPYKKLYEVYQDLQQQGFSLDTLSMGMSNDFVAAIAEGSTLVRIGTAIFGERFQIAK